MSAQTLYEKARNVRAVRLALFGVVGTVGFVIDAAVLFLLTRCFGMGPIIARLGSVAVAIVVTFELNRLWASDTRQDHRRVSTFGSYLFVQGAGFICNFFIYIVLLRILNASPLRPILCLAISSIAAMIINYLGLLRFVFRRRQT